MSNYNTPSSDGELKVTRTSEALSAIHGQNAHDLILCCLNDGMTHQEIAEQLSTPNFPIQRAWVSWFIRENYRKSVRWERAS